MNYYGLRYYSPGVGRWLKRDPTGEIGCINQYCFLHNSSGNRIGALGERDVLPNPGDPGRPIEPHPPWQPVPPLSGEEENGRRLQTTVYERLKEMCSDAPCCTSEECSTSAHRLAKAISEGITEAREDLRRKFGIWRMSGALGNEFRTGLRCDEWRELVFDAISNAILDAMKDDEMVCFQASPLGVPQVHAYVGIAPCGGEIGCFDPWRSGGDWDGTIMDEPLGGHLDCTDEIPYGGPMPPNGYFKPW